MEEEPCLFMVPEEWGLHQQICSSGNYPQKVEPSSPDLNKIAEYGKVKVQLAETPTQFMTSLHIGPEPDLICIYGNHPVYIQNANAFVFVPEETPIETGGQSSSLSGGDDNREEFNGQLVLLQTSSSNQDPDHPEVSQVLSLPNYFSVDDHTSLVSFSNQSPPSCEDRGFQNVEAPTKRRRGRHPDPIPDYISIFQENPPRYQCKICLSIFKTKTSINHHAFCANKDKEKPYKCQYEQCGRGFIRKSHYEYHLLTHTCEKPFVCDCGKSFNCKSTLVSHKRSHSHISEAHAKIQQSSSKFQAKAKRNHERNVTCDICGKRIPHGSYFKRHLMSHSDVAPLKCSICGKSFKLKHHLLRHLVNIHNQPKTDAEKLVNDAGLEYLKKTVNYSLPAGCIPVSRIYSTVLSTALKNSKITLPNGVKTYANLSIDEKEIVTGSSGGSFLMPDSNLTSQSGSSSTPASLNFQPLNQSTESLSWVETEMLTF